ncbi:FitA-like ribbon-helix-helix domain-containing protein [Loktanella salsilacus]|uniref:FitA-like ribbon-helix-helix domain-containing protein n=1 Tax=Loktanella salsilacus TaxID=195913 RepID=UPI000B7F9F13
MLRCRLDAVFQVLAKPDANRWVISCHDPPLPHCEVDSKSKFIMPHICLTVRLFEEIEMKTLRLRLSEEEKGWLERRATENGRSMNAELRQLLKNSMANGHGGL